MANDNNEICEIIKKCKILLLDIEGTTTSISFVKDTLFPYVQEKVKGFLEGQWDSDDVKVAVAALRKQAAEDKENSVEGLVDIPGEDASKDEQIEGLVANIKWQMAADRKVGPLKQLQGFIWKLGYDKGDIKGHIYDDVSPALELWRSTEGQKVYIYSSGSVQAQKLLFNKSQAGDMLPLIEGHFDTSVGAKQEAASYAAIVEKIGCKAEEILFLTDIVKEADAARASGLHAALVSREGNAPLPTEASIYPVLHSFEQLTVTNKRKPDQQVEEVPAKVPKTDAQIDVKTSEPEAESAKINGSTKTVDAMKTAVVVEKAEAPEIMEIEETPDVVVAETKDSIKINESVVETKIVTEVAEITEKDVPMDDVVADVPAVAESAPVETTVAMADSTKIAETVVSESINVTAPSAENANVESSIAEGEIAVPQVAKTYVKEVICGISSLNPRVKMVDAATLTEDIVITDCSKTVESSETANVASVVSKPADAVTEIIKTANAEEATASLNTKTFDENSEIKETPAAEATAEVSPAIESTTMDVVTKDTMDAPATASKDVEANSSSVTDVVEFTETETEITADSTAEETPTTDLKTEEVSSVDSKAMVTAEDVAEADAKESIGTTTKVSEIPTSESPVVSDSTEVADAAVDENVSATEIEPVQNGVTKSADKPEEMAIEEEVEKVPDQIETDDAQVCVIEPVAEKYEEKTESNETEKIETEAAVIEKLESVVEPQESAEKDQDNAAKEAMLSPIEIKDITDDKESLSEVTDISDDVVPIIEEPSHLEEMEELQNAGDVLEKECDEILSKVQDVTNLDYMPVKPLHTIAEEMDAENTDTNDIVERILDSEMELEMKPEDIDLNTVQEITEPIPDTDERIGKTEPGTEKPIETPKDVAEEKMEVSCDAEMIVEKPSENTVEPMIDNTNKAKIEPIVEEMETEEAKVELVKEVEAVEISKPQESKTDKELPVVVEPVAKLEETETKAQNKESEKPSATVVQENGGSKDAKIDKATDTKVNGKSNGDATVKLNGDARKDEDLKSRLTAETVKEKVNGSNGSAVADTGNAQGDNKVEAETPEIKVKTVATDEAHTPMKQPVEA